MMERKTVLLTGGTGFIGRHLYEALIEAGNHVVILSRSRTPNDVPWLDPLRAQLVNHLDEIDRAKKIHCIVNLAGKPLPESRWNERVKKELVDSRVRTTQALVAFIQQREHTVEHFVSASAVGWYGDQQTDRALLDESSDAVDDFPHRLCAEWERTALAANDLNVPTALMRIGVVVGRGGAVSSMLPPFKWGLGGPIGRGDNIWSWIHIDDLIRAFVFVMENKMQGPVNGVSPYPCTQSDFCDALAKAIHRPCFTSLPGPVANLLLGEFARDVLQASQNVNPSRLQEREFSFQFEQIDAAMRDVLPQL